MKIDQLINDYHEVFDGKPWHGASVMETLRSISPGIVNTRSEGKSHTIAELVKHMLNWRNFVIERLNGNSDFSIELNSNLDWEENFIIEDEKEWESLIGELNVSQEKLAEALMKKGEDWLVQKAPSEDYNNEFMLRGIIFHDVYHLGQIRLIQKLIGQK